jgi:hypothetical protein
MNDLADTRSGRTRVISDAEMARRREMLRYADASNRIEGALRRPETDTIFEAFVRGEIDVTEIIPLLDTLPRSR